MPQTVIQQQEEKQKQRCCIFGTRFRVNNTYTVGLES